MIQKMLLYFNFFKIPIQDIVISGRWGCFNNVLDRNKESQILGAVLENEFLSL